MRLYLFGRVVESECNVETFCWLLTLFCRIISNDGMYQFGANPLGIYRKNNCPHCELSRRLQDRARARQWLAQFTSDVAAMRAMRRLLAEEPGSSNVPQLGDAEVMDAVADLLSRGALHVHAPSAYLDFGKASTTSSPSAAKQIPYPIGERQPRAASSTPQATDPPTFQGNLDAAAQAATLQAAAAQGKPFCPE